MVVMGDSTMKAARTLAASALLLIGGALMATPALAAPDGCIDGLDGKPICTPHVGPPPPPDSLRPAPLPPPGYDNSPNQFVPAPAAPAPVYQPPAAPQPVYIAPPPAPVNNFVPAQPIPAPAPVINAPAPQTPSIVEATAAPESVQNEVAPAATVTGAVEPSVDVVAAPSIEPVEAHGDPVAIEAAPTSSASNNTPVIIVGVASVIVLGGVAWLVLHFGPGVSGIRGIARGLIRR